MRFFMLVASLGAIISISTLSSAQSVDYQKAQQAGKVWGDKIGENDRSQRTREPPATPAERRAALDRYRADYDRLVDSVGVKNADRWLDFKARQGRRRR